MGVQKIMAIHCIKDLWLTEGLVGVANLSGSLTWLDFRRNNFRGQISLGLGHLTLLTCLDLSMNNLHGEILP